MTDIYEAEAGVEEGWGHANFDRTFTPPADDAGLIDHDAIPLFTSEIFTRPA